MADCSDASNPDQHQHQQSPNADHVKKLENKLRCPLSVSVSISDTAAVSDISGYGSGYGKSGYLQSEAEIFGGRTEPDDEGSDTEYDSATDDLANAASPKTNVYRSQSVRSSSLPSPVTSPNAKKVVRFADSMGLDLTSVSSFRVQSSNENLLQAMLSGESSSSEGAVGGAGCVSAGAEARSRLSRKLSLSSRFVSPGTLPDFLRFVQHHKVALQQCDLSDSKRTVSGLIRVANLSYQKKVTVRFSFDDWLTYEEKPAVYIQQNSNSQYFDCGLTDLFSFCIQIPPIDDANCDHVTAVVFSMCYTTSCGDTYWDNNGGSNYRVELYDR